MSYIIGNIPSAAHLLDVKHLAHYRDTTSLCNGDIVEFFGHIFQWDNDCVSEDLCERWRLLGDPLCDNALEEMFPHPSSTVGKDLLQSLETYVAEHPGLGPASDFLEEVSRLPPYGIKVSPEEAILAQEFFLDHSVQIMQALLHYSLAGGFASPRIVRTLQAVSYLVPHSSSNSSKALFAPMLDASARISQSSNERTFSRLLETFQFVLDVMDCTAHSRTTVPPAPAKAAAYLMPGGEGWKSIVRVRMLHGVARMRVKARWKRDSDTVDEKVAPINQEEMSATLASFSTVPIWCLNRLQMPPTATSASAYLSLWKHVGFYLGVSPDILRRYFSNLHTADKFLASMALHLFSTDDDPITVAAYAPTIPILRATANRPPAYMSFEDNCALTRHLLGPALASHLGIQPTALRARIWMHASLLIQRMPQWFSTWYPRRGWIRKRREVLREGIARSLRWNLGMRRTSFRPRTDLGVCMSAASHSADDVGGALAVGVKEAEGVLPDPAGAKVLVRKWRRY
ncbi:hypothetical protein A0H81_02676 [Grifola frondosa]|uniref:ER-bound oxygenase mpaB/mpaB'/Rubber oxygenase catalytic domain-containing protein n=1 Tax=Grifola frondosa TaxID=5627 RepID=A0A1C7MN47_GRIFR|nr:hypothetical protein A0H81_02676 [Grifola frondosa]